RRVPTRDASRFERSPEPGVDPVHAHGSEVDEHYQRERDPDQRQQRRRLALVPERDPARKAALRGRRRRGFLLELPSRGAHGSRLEKSSTCCCSRSAASGSALASRGCGTGLRSSRMRTRVTSARSAKICSLSRCPSPAYVGGGPERDGLYAARMRRYSSSG